MPHAERGMAVGLFGGSFNPPHEGHVLVSEIAIRRLRLDQLWWMVTPGNPLKSRRELASLPDRLAQSERLVHDPRIKITAFEQTLGTSYTAETLAFVKARNPHVHFIWIMGADSLKTFHLWQKWREIAATFPIAVIDRPGATLSFLSSQMARALANARIDEDDAGVLWKRQAPAWTFIHGPRSTLSSTALRAKGTEEG
ncbi:nicotinate-nucleotide adenylyltransferase [Neorhizobium lilium]|uniref:Probable nicotinate-nucleotide adenylyltransferase n=1 Tax=Neorhizobium lilium TaxID=2503024 RepID=A0A3S3VEB0_9HYPH|nr:nicotinate-nucleotide adenylyltransferase [Neorhizobium lilium]RWX74627.1 nicotinate-nucleotide adenylyltransferase [Neorhizobium lilium]